MKKLFLLCAVWMACIVTAQAQEWLGIINSNYAGVTAVPFNPSSMSASRLKWDINVIGADVFFQNNYIYSPGIFGTKPPKEKQEGDYDMIKDYYTVNPTKNAFAQVALRLPSVMFRIKKHTFAITTGYRAVASVEDLPYNVAKFSFNQLNFGYTPQHGILYQDRDYKINAMAWSEINFSYAYPVINSYKNYLSAGVTVKNMFANAGISFQSRAMDYTVINKSRMVVYNADLELSHALTNEDFLFAGYGLGNLDIGFTYIRKQLPGEFIPYTQRKNILKYKYKIGASLIDIGRINYSNNARKNKVDKGTDWVGIDTVQFKNFDYFDTALGNQFYKDPNGTFVDNQFYMGLPTALCVNYDFNLDNNANTWYLGGALVQSVPLISPSVVRPTIFSIGPRYETQRFEISMPYSFYNMTDHRIGLAMRFNWFIIGTDKFGSFLGLNDFTGTDLYFAIKVPRYSENINSENYFACVFKRIVKKFKRRNTPRGAIRMF